MNEKLNHELEENKRLNKYEKEFLKEIEAVCRKHDLSITHEDGQGAFIIREYDEHYINWLFQAY